MQLLRFLVLAAALVVATSAIAGGREPVGAPVVVQLVPADGAMDSTDAVRALIVDTAKAKGWRVFSDTPGVLRLELTVRGKHHVVADVAYDDKRATITYVTSQNMDFKVKHGEPWIHSSYVRWVRLLADAIERRSRGM
jgi:hypothetical protein